jgi:hypothetical protein
MKTLFGSLMFVLAAQAYAQSLEADLDGNAAALQASEMRPQPQPSRPVAKAKSDRQRLAAR